MHERAREILDFWFGTPDAPDSGERWFKPDPMFDQEIRARFGSDLERAAEGVEAHLQRHDLTELPAPRTRFGRLRRSDNFDVGEALLHEIGTDLCDCLDLRPFAVTGFDS